MISLEDMRSIIQEWFSQANNLCDLAEIYYTIRDESTIQFEFIAKEIINRVNKKPDNYDHCHVEVVYYDQKDYKEDDE